MGSRFPTFVMVVVVVLSTCSGTTNSRTGCKMSNIAKGEERVMTEKSQPVLFSEIGGLDQAQREQPPRQMG